MRNLHARLNRLERDTAEGLIAVQCDFCHDWPSVCVKRVDIDGTETWDTEEPHECPRCGWTAHLVIFEIVEDWSKVTVPSRGR